jgi:CSLREA domain-containing protein
MKNRFNLFLRFVLAVLFLGLLAGSSSAATWTVTKTADTNDGTCDADCSLREAIVRSNQTPASDTIVFSPLFNSPQTITLTLGELNITTTMVIEGPGARLLSVSGGGVSRVISVSAGGSATLNNFAIRNGNATTGGGILNSGNVVMTFMTVAGNVAEGGAGILSTGTLNISASTISGNNLSVLSVGASGAGIRIVGGTATISNTTISGNSAATASVGGAGGGIVVAGATVNMNNVTIANNVASGPEFGAGLFHGGNSSINLRNCLIANNLSLGNPDDVSSPNVLNLFTSNGNNLIESVQPDRGFTNGVNGDIVGLDPGLSPTLANNGGSTDTHSLLIGSLAMDAGNSCVASGSCGVNNVIILTDQRGTGFARLVGSAVDIGAYEYVAPTAAGVVVGGRVTNAYGRGIGNVRITLTGVDPSDVKVAYTSSFGYYQFEDVPAGQTYVLTAIAKRYSFSDPVRLINVADPIQGEDFVALP